MNRFTITIVLIYMILCHSVNAQTWKWAVGSNCPRGTMESSRIAADGLGNVYESGVALPTGSVPGYLLKSYFGTDSIVGGGALLVSTDSSGNYRWEIQIGPYSLFDVFTDNRNYVYIVGGFYTSLIIGSDTLNSSSFAGFCAKINSSGTIIWLKKICDSSSIGLGSVDDGGNVYLAGTFNGSSATLGTSTITNASIPGKSDALIVKLDSNGATQWAKCFGGDSTEMVASIKVSHNGDAYVEGTYNSTAFSLAGTTFTVPSAGVLWNGFCAKVNASGVMTWARQITARGSFFTHDLAIDQSQNLYLAGYYTHNLIFATDSFSSMLNSRMFLTSYDSTGHLRWTRTTTDLNFMDAQSVAADLCGNVWISGLYNPFAIDNMYICKFDSSGNPLDTLLLQSGGHNQNAITVDNMGNLYLGAAYTSTNFIVGTDTLMLTDSTVDALFIARYSYPFCLSSPPLEVNQSIANCATPIFYPNPAFDEINVVLPFPEYQIIKADLFDMTGRLISSLKLSGNSCLVDASKVKGGVYLCKITTTNNNEYTGKIVIIR